MFWTANGRRKRSAAAELQTWYGCRDFGFSERNAFADMQQKSLEDTSP
jgi:hypothetical protein